MRQAGKQSGRWRERERKRETRARCFMGYHRREPPPACGPSLRRETARSLYLLLLLPRRTLFPSFSLFRLPFLFPPPVFPSSPAVTSHPVLSVSCSPLSTGLLVIPGVAWRIEAIPKRVNRTGREREPLFFVVEVYYIVFGHLRSRWSEFLVGNCFQFLLCFIR